MKIWMRFALIVVLATAIAGCGQEQSTTTTSDVDLSAALPMDPNVRTGKLDNGLTYYIKANEKPEDRAELRLAVNAGSILEDEQQLGLAHFAEHMLFNGTENFEKNELIDFFELTGQKFGAHVNAYTSFDETVYMLKPRTDSQEVFDMGFQVLEDWPWTNGTYRLNLPSAKLEDIQSVIIDPEFRMADIMPDNGQWPAREENK